MYNEVQDPNLVQSSLTQENLLTSLLDCICISVLRDYTSTPGMLVLNEMKRSWIHSTGVAL